ncbi:MAG: hypothetical protein EAZ06_01675 [Cytophagales bacterium]|nr:MAG: hypothetical protein EAZ06_01675 [Cytophagales bacterium]
MKKIIKKTPQKPSLFFANTIKNIIFASLLSLTNKNKMRFEILSNVKQSKKDIPLKKLIQIKVEKIKVALLRIDDQKWIAFKDACPHLQVPLTKGELTDDNCVLCIFHRYKFSLEDGKEVGGKNTSPLRFFKISEEKNQLFIDIDDEDLIEKDEFSF